MSQEIEELRDIEDIADPHTEIIGKLRSLFLSLVEEADPDRFEESPLPEFPKAILTRFVKQLSGESGIKISQEYKNSLVSCLQTTVYYLSFL